MAGRFSVEAVFKAIDKVTAPVSRMMSNVGKFTRSSRRAFKSLTRTVMKFGSALKSAAMGTLRIATVGVGLLTASVGLLIREFSKVENAVAAFTPLLGGAAKAKKMVDELNKTAATTPFQFEALADATSMLLPVMNGNIAETISLIRTLGDTAGGNVQKLESITRGFTKAMLKGKVDMESLNMIAEAGVPIFTELAKSMGVSQAKFFKMVTAGKVSTAQLNKAFKTMTKEGGIFFRGMEIASKTTTGLFSTLKDNISLTAAELGSVLAPTVKALIIQLTKVAQEVRAWVTANKNLIATRVERWIEFVKTSAGDMFDIAKGGAKIVAGLTLAFVGLKIAVLAANVAILAYTVLMGTVGAVTLFFTNTVAGLAIAIALLTAKQWLWNAALTANPIGLIIAAIAALVAAGVMLVKNWDKVKSFFVGLWDTLKVIFGGIWSFVSGFFDLFTSGTRDMARGLEGLDPKLSMLVDDRRDPNRTTDDAGIGDFATVSPQDRIARSVEESRETSTASLTIKDETGRAELKQQGPMTGLGIKLEPSGAF